MASTNTTDTDTDERSDDQVTTSTLGRLVRAVELIASAHASRAREEAGKDLSRMASGGLLLLLGLLLFVPIVALLDVALSLLIADRAPMSLALSLACVAGGNALVALVLGLTARSRLSSPVLVETRATLKRAAIVLRGN